MNTILERTKLFGSIYRKHLLILCALLVTVSVAYKLGTQRPATVINISDIPETATTNEKIPTVADKLVCYSDSASTDLYKPSNADRLTTALKPEETKCYFPVETNSYQFQNHLECQGITSHYLQKNYQAKALGPPSSSYSGLWTSSKKDDTYSFTLDFSNDTVVRSRLHRGEIPDPFKIVQDSEDIIQAVRPTKDNNTGKVV
jgi:hypothetical protein